MKYSKKQVMSLILSGALTISTCEMAVKALDKENTSERGYDLLYNIDSFNVNGLYKVLIDNKAIYVYLNNDLENKYLEKEEALKVGKINYKNTYIYSKTVDNPDYDKGSSLLTDKKITIYALSDKTYVNGWSRVNSLSNKEKVATTIELGEFLLKRVKLENYKTNMLGFANIDINRDGVSEIVYIGNNKDNQLFDKNEAIKWANARYNNYYILSKTVHDSSIKRSVVIYSISDKSYVSGWNLVNKNSITKDETLATNPEYYDALIRIIDNSKTLKVDKITERYIKVAESQTTNEIIYYPYNYMFKEDALKYGYTYYKDFCILTKTIYNVKTKQNEVLYAFSSQVNVEGWSIIGNDYISKNNIIFLSLNDAYNYEYNITNNYSKTIK